MFIDGRFEPPSPSPHRHPLSTPMVTTQTIRRRPSSDYLPNKNRRVTSGVLPDRVLEVVATATAADPPARLAPPPARYERESPGFQVIPINTERSASADLCTVAHTVRATHVHSPCRVYTRSAPRTYTVRATNIYTVRVLPNLPLTHKQSRPVRSVTRTHTFARHFARRTCPRRPTR